LRGVSRRLIAVLAGLLAWAASAPASAYEDQASIDGEIAYVHAFAKNPGAANGIGVAAGASLGLTNEFTLRGQFMWAFHRASEPSVSIAWLSADLVYVIDVLEIVPYFGAGVDAAAQIQSGERVDAEFGLHPAIGFDYLVSRKLALGVQVKPVFLLTALDRLPVYLQAGLTLSYLLDL
jgi:hypothetical protein